MTEERIRELVSQLAKLVPDFHGEHVAGRRCDPWGNPLARRLRRHWRTVANIRVDGFSVTWTSRYGDERFVLPPILSQFLIDFNAGRYPELVEDD